MEVMNKESSLEDSYGDLVCGSCPGVVAAFQKKRVHFLHILSPFVRAVPANLQKSIGHAVGCVCCRNKTPQINGVVGRCPSTASGTRRALDKHGTHQGTGSAGPGVARRARTPGLHQGLELKIPDRFENCQFSNSLIENWWV